MKKSYWIGEHLLNQIINKALSITKSIYSGYKLLFMFENTISHSIYAKNALQVAYINEKPSSQQLFL